MPRGALRLAASLALWAAKGPTPLHALIFELDGHAEECFHEYVRTKRTAYLSLGVLEAAGAYDVRLRAFGPFSTYPEQAHVEQNFFDHVVATPVDDASQNVERSGFNFDSEHRGGWYRFCLGNLHDGSPKVVEWHTSLELTNAEDVGEEDKLDEQTRREHLEAAMTSLRRLQSLLKLIRHEQEYYRARVHRHVQTLGSSESRIVYYTVVELAVLGAMYAAQSFLLHKWFQDRGYLSTRKWA